MIGSAENCNFNTGGYHPLSGTFELANASGLGSGTVIFSGDSNVEIFATLQIDTSDTPSNGSTFASQLRNCGEYGVGGDALDLSGLWPCFGDVAPDQRKCSEGGCGAGARTDEHRAVKRAHQPNACCGEH